MGDTFIIFEIPRLYIAPRKEKKKQGRRTIAFCLFSNLDVGDHVEHGVLFNDPAGELLMEGLLLGLDGHAAGGDGGVEVGGLFDGVGVGSEELTDDAGGFGGEASWLDDGNSHGFLKKRVEDFFL